MVAKAAESQIALGGQKMGSHTSNDTHVRDVSQDKYRLHVRIDFITCVLWYESHLWRSQAGKAPGSICQKLPINAHIYIYKYSRRWEIYENHDSDVEM